MDSLVAAMDRQAGGLEMTERSKLNEPRTPDRQSNRRRRCRCRKLIDYKEFAAVAQSDVDLIPTRFGDQPLPLGCDLGFEGEDRRFFGKFQERGNIGISE